MVKNIGCIVEIDGYGCILNNIQNYYPVEIDKPGIWCWGFKYKTGIFEFFSYLTKEEAVREQKHFVVALEEYLEKRKNGL